jgi:hypothetical protein
MITYESICEKIGFQFDVKSQYPTPPDYEDDSIPSPLAPLSLEELEWVVDFMTKKDNVRRAAEVAVANE